MGRIEPKIIGVAVAAVGIGVGLTGCSSGGGLSVTGNCAIVYRLLTPSGIKSFPTQAAADSYSAANFPSDPESPIPGASITLKATSGGTVKTVNIEYFGASGQIPHAPFTAFSPFALSAGQTWKSSSFNGGPFFPSGPAGATSCKVAGVS